MPLLLRFQWELPAFVADCQIRIQDDEGRASRRQLFPALLYQVKECGGSTIFSVAAFRIREKKMNHPHHLPDIINYLAKRLLLLIDDQDHV